jgi:hypothetical protein
VLKGLVFCLAYALDMMSGISYIVHDEESIEVLIGNDLPLLQRKGLVHLAMLHFVGRVIIVDPFFGSSSSTTRIL